MKYGLSFLTFIITGPFTLTVMMWSLLAGQIRYFFATAGCLYICEVISELEGAVTLMKALPFASNLIVIDIIASIFWCLVLIVYHIPEIKDQLRAEQFRRLPKFR
jgi:hypothetical protein